MVPPESSGSATQTLPSPELAGHAGLHEHSGALLPRVLWVTGSRVRPAWGAEALASDGNGPSLRVVKVPNVAGALSHVREEPFESLVISHQPPQASAIRLLEALYLYGGDQPVVVLSEERTPEFLRRCFELGAEAVLSFDALTPTTLVYVVRRAIDRFHLVRDNQRLSRQEHRRLVKERDEVDCLLEQQRHITCDLEALCRDQKPDKAPDGANKGGPDAQGTRSGGGPMPAKNANASTEQPGTNGHAAESDADDGTPAGRNGEPDLPPDLVTHYRELLRTHIIMGSGNLSREIAHLSHLLATLGVTARRVLSLHLESVEQLIRGLGRRSTRHVLSRADLLVLELTVNLAQRYQEASAGTPSASS